MTEQNERFGAVLDGSAGVRASTVRTAACDHGFALVRDCRFTEEEFRAFVDGLGNTVRYEDEVAGVGYGFTDVLYLDGAKDKIITGRGGLPLHTDGVLLGTQVDLIVLFAQAASGGREGATVVCDQLRAWAEMPYELAELIDDGYLEYRAEERGYFTSVPEGWYKISTTRDYGRVRSLNLALPFEADSPNSWSVRVPGVDSGTSTRKLDALAEFLYQPEYLYEHHWQVGDLVVIDNQRTLHGRRGLAGTDRVLMRGQTNLS